LATSKKRRGVSGNPAHMDAAVELSLKESAKGAGGPFGAVVVHRGSVIARGYNQVTSQNDPTCHAEIVAIRAACKKLNAFHLKGCELYTSCEPCPMCLGAVYWARLERVFYALSRRDAARIGFSDEFIYQELEKSHEKRLIPMIHLVNERAKEAFRQWRANPSRIMY
jgi:guanine deaminase